VSDISQDRWHWNDGPCGCLWDPQEDPSSVISRSVLGLAVWEEGARYVTPPGGNKAQLTPAGAECGVWQFYGQPARQGVSLE
jgi:hypothetical protein